MGAAMGAERGAARGTAMGASAGAGAGAGTGAGAGARKASGAGAAAAAGASALGASAAGASALGWAAPLAASSMGLAWVSGAAAAAAGSLGRSFTSCEKIAAAAASEGVRRPSQRGHLVLPGRARAPGECAPRPLPAGGNFNTAHIKPDGSRAAPRQTFSPGVQGRGAGRPGPLRACGGNCISWAICVRWEPRRGPTCAPLRAPAASGSSYRCRALLRF
jgi:hypothetical protein